MTDERSVDIDDEEGPDLGELPDEVREGLIEDDASIEHVAVEEEEI